MKKFIAVMATIALLALSVSPLYAGSVFAQSLEYLGPSDGSVRGIDGVNAFNEACLSG